MQGDKAAGRNWHTCLKLEAMKKKQTIICLSTDDFLCACSSVSLFRELENHLKKFFNIAKIKGSLLRCLNCCIVQSEHGVSIDQTQNHCYFFFHNPGYFFQAGLPTHACLVRAWH